MSPRLLTFAATKTSITPTTIPTTTTTTTTTRRRTIHGWRKIGCSPSSILLPLLLGIYLWISLSLSNVHQVPQDSSHPTPPKTEKQLQKQNHLHHDPYFVRNRYNSFLKNTTFINLPGVCDVPPGQGEEGPDGIQGLYKIKMADQKMRLLEAKENRNTSNPSTKSLKVFCMVYTHSERHEDVLKSIVETYAPYCDGFLAASNRTEPELGAIYIPHPGPESYGNMWNKVQSMWRYVYIHYLLDFDWFHIGGDDMYVLPNSLRRTVQTFDQKKPRILGGSIPYSKNPKRRFCGGGAGYTLNRKALYLLMEQIQLGECPSELASDEDIKISRCFDDVGIQCTDTNDEEEEVRYHPLDVQYHSAWTPDRPALWLWEKLQYFHGIRGNQSLLGQISKTSVSFHLDKSTIRSMAKDRGIRRYHAILYDDLCGPNFATQVADVATTNARNETERIRISRLWKKTPKAKDFQP